ncbi:MAG: hypothetical protein ACTSYA_10025 [Candidatus Kariarchaeaceae archaeon]
MITDDSLAFKSPIYLADPLERESLASNLTEQDIHFHVIDAIINLQDKLENKAKLLTESIPYKHLISSRILELSFKSLISPEDANSLLLLVFS